MVVFEWHVAFVAGFDNFDPLGLRKGFGIEGVASGARNRRKEVVVDAMVLVGDEASIEIEHATHGGRVLLGDANVKPASSAWFPFGDFLAVLKHRVEDVDGAAPDMGTLEVIVVGELHASEELDWRQTRATLRHVVPKVDGMVEGHRPEVESSFARPVNNRMEHHGASP
jgi:hypothetical protein